MRELAETLRRLRALAGVTLREIEKNTKLSNAYISQLENDNTSNPSPHVLHTLAKYFGVSYESLMEAAGYLRPPSPNGTGRRPSALESALMSAKLTEEEQKQVADFIEFVRGHRRDRKK